MTYANVRYISMARLNEMRQHECTMEELRAKIAQLTKSVAWEVKQHQARIQELQQAEDTLSMDHSTIPAMNTQPTLEQVPSSKRRGIKTKKYVHRPIQIPVAQLVG